MAIFSPVQQEVNPIDPINVGAPMAEGLAGLSRLFLSAPKEQRAATQNELFGERVREFGEAIQKPGWNPAQATMGELRKFGSAYPEFGQEVFTVAKAGINEELAAAENALTITQSVQKANEEAWLTSPEGVYANAKAQEYANEDEAAAFILKSRAEWQATSAENAAIKREVDTQGAYDTLSVRAWKTNTTSAKTEADIFARGIEQLSLAIAADPTATFNLDDTGITQLIPELRGTTVNQRNIVSVANIARGALETKFRKDIAAKTGIDANNLGVAPDDWNKSVFNTFDTTVTWTANEVDPATIQKRLEGEAFIAMADAGVPTQYLSLFAKLSGANPALSAQLMASLSGPVGAFNERLMSGQLEEANRALQEASKQDLIDARYAFTELVAVMSGQSTLARTYEEVTQDQKDTEISIALGGAFKSHRELQRTEGPTRWNRAAWRQNFEVPADSIVRRSATDNNFASEAVGFMSSDIMLDLGNLRDAAAPNGVNISISENGQVVISATDQAAPLQGNQLGVGALGIARRPLTPGDKLRMFTEENKAIIDDINYKMTVLGRLGGVGKSTMDILRAEVPSAETTTRAGGAGSQSTSTADRITYALPEAIAADTEFLDKVVSVSSELGFDPNDLLRVIDFETAGSFSPKAQPIRKDGTKISSATGLIQFLEKTAKGLGTTTADLANMTAVEQLDFVKAYFEPFKGRIKNFGDVYMAVHWPAGVGKDDSYVMYKKGSDSYNANKGLDTNGDGTVTRGETLARLFSATGKGGNPTAGTPANENTLAAAAGPATQRAVAPTSGAPMTMPSGGAPVAPVTTGEMTEATLPEAIPAETPTGTQGASELSPAIAVDKDVQAFIQEIAGDPDKTYASAEEFTAAQERGELEPGDTVVVNEEIYVIRKDGSARKLGSLTP